MSFDGSAGSPGDTSPQMTSSGTMTTGGELHSAGVREDDGVFMTEMKLNDFRRQSQLPVDFSPGGTVGSAVFLLLLVSFILFINIYDPIHNRLKPERPLTDFDAIYPTSAIDRSMRASRLAEYRASNLRDLQRTLTTVYKPGTNLKDIFSKCGSKACTSPDYAAFMAFRQFAVNPDNYVTDLCQALANTKTAYSSIIPNGGTWKLEQSKNMGPGTYVCAFQEWRPYWREYNSARSRAEVLAYVFSVGAIVLMWSILYLMFRPKKN